MDNTATKSRGSSREAGVSRLEAMARKLLFSTIEDLEMGELMIQEGARTFRFGTATEEHPLSARIFVHDPAFYPQTLFGGSLGAGEAYMHGHWTADDLTAVVRLFVRNTDLLNRKLDSGWARVTAPVHKALHALRRNTVKGSRKNIVAHYDLSNDFFRSFLDETMAYSCGVFETENSTLAEASVAKFERFCRKLKLGPDDRLIEVGGGWGGFAIHAARNYGCHVTTTTISGEQFAFARERVKAEGLEDRIKVIRKDYRHLEGRFDKLVSIEMIEAVGHHYLDRFFQCCRDLLRPGGLMGIQAITVPDHEFHRHIRSVDFIRKFIFPGGCIPSMAVMKQSAIRAASLKLVHVEDITPHYARTLKLWRDRFFANVERVRQMGFSDTFIRMWDFYLSSCEGGFAEGYNGNVQLVFARSGPEPARSGRP